jgi:transcriptional regulator with XRE-family HTH domain
MDIDSNLLGAIIKEQRKELNMTQRELAGKIGTSQGYIADLENGKKKNPTSGTLIKLADALKISKEELILAIVPEDKRKQIIEEQNAEYESVTEELTEIILSFDKEESYEVKRFLSETRPGELTKELNLIFRFRKLSPISQQTVITLVENLEKIDQAQSEQAAESEVG